MALTLQLLQTTNPKLTQVLTEHHNAPVFSHGIIFMNFGIKILRKINFYMIFCNICSYSTFVNIRLINWFLQHRFLGMLSFLFYAFSSVFLEIGKNDVKIRPIIPPPDIKKLLYDKNMIFYLNLCLFCSFINLSVGWLVK